ncbi:hypothetical protein F2Q69_00047561 [Brassica cretica]|uniref:Uncharacterized protein n=1 Tax=Brassica cretica TaxID=69181 RepID=A0A8S9PX83_BRACR|nr:hypothetical protein F2Q69_00047561 [Brassica cretica]
MFTLFLSTDRHSIEECLFQLRKSTEFAGFEGGQSALTRATYCKEVFSSGRRILWIMGILLRLAKSCGIFSFAHALGGRQPGRDMRPGLSGMSLSELRKFEGFSQGLCLGCLSAGCSGHKPAGFHGFEGGQSALTRAAYCEEAFSSGRRILWIMGILLRLAKSCGIFSFTHALGGRQPGRDMRPGLRATSSRVYASGKEILVLALVSEFSAVILFDRLREADFSRIVIPRHRHVLASAMVVLFLASGLERSTSLVHGSEELGRASAGYMIVLRNLRLDS